MDASSKVTAPRTATLDGIRAVAVVMVLLYHLQVPGMGGGFIGVEVFFVLSGFLITGLLMAASDRVIDGDHTVRQVWFDFWTRRQRRLLPAMLLVLIAVTVVWVLWRPAQYDVVRLDGLAALLGLQNWWFIAHDVSYADTFAGQSPLLHLWSLSIEAQFYLVWPALVFLIGLSFRRRGWTRVRRSLGIAVAIAATIGASYLLIRWGQSDDPSGAYFNSLARASGLLAGAALAFARPLHRWTGRGQRPAAAGTISVAALALLLVAAVVLRQNQGLTYSGAMVAVDLASVALIASVLANPRSPVARALGSRLPVWIGSRSYAIYLWHWPLIVWFEQQSAPGMLRLGYGVIVVAASLVLAQASWYLVEKSRRPRGRRSVIGFATAAAMTVVVAIAVPLARPYTPPDYLTNAPVAINNATPSPAPAPTVGDAPAAPTTQATTAPPAPTTQATAAPTTPAPATDPTSCGVSLVGDSVMLGAQSAITSTIPNIKTFDAAVGLQFQPGMDILSDHLAAGELGCVVVIALGTNGSYNTDSILAFAAQLPPTSRIVLVNTQAPRSWTDKINRQMRQVRDAAPHGQMIVADWYSWASANTDQLATDGVHMRTDTAQQQYATVILNTISICGAGAALN